MNDSNSHYLIKSYVENVNERPHKAVDRVYEDLLRRIASLELPPGAPLVRGVLCEEYQVSQTPVREALLRLEQLGLINVRPQSGTEVAYIDVAQLQQNHFLREALECEVVLRLAQSGTSNVIKHLNSIVNMQAEVVEEDQEDLQLFAKLDELFHRAMYEAVGQTALHELVRARSGHMDRVRRLDLPTEGKIRDVLADHRNIINALEQGDEHLAVAAMRAHLAGTIARVQVLAHEFPEYFC